jgi:CheY-like chemotaxis protein
MDGFELCRRLKTLNMPPRTVLVHSSGDRRVAVLAGEVGADATLRRPFQGFQLARRLEELMGSGFFADKTMPSATKGPEDTGMSPAAASLVDPMTGVFYGAQGDDVDVQISADESWAEAVVSAAIQPLDDEDLPGRDEEEDDDEVLGPDQTQDLPELAVQTFDEDNPVSVPVGACTTAHFRPIRMLGDDEPEEPEPSSASGSPQVVASDPEASRSTGLGPATGGFLPAEAELPPSKEQVEDIVRQEFDRLVAPGGQLASAIQRSVATAVATAMRQVLPALASEAARMAATEPGEAEAEAE